MVIDSQQERHDGRRDRILRAALEVFARRGFHQALLDEVAKVAGVGKGTIYLYVPDKEGLLLEAIQHQMGVHEREIREQVASAHDPIDQLYRLIYLEFQHYLSNVELAKVLLAEKAALGFSPEFAQAMETMRRERKQLVVSIMKAGQDSGALRADVSAETLALAFMGLIGGPVFDIIFDDGPRLEPTEAARSYLDLFLQGSAGPEGVRAN